MAEEKPPEWFQEWTKKEVLVSKIIETLEKLYAFFGALFDRETEKKQLMKLNVKSLENLRDVFWDDLQKVTTGRPTARGIRILKDRIKKCRREKERYAALEEHYRNVLAGLQDFKCEICGRAISWVGGQRRKYCEQCARVVANVRSKEWGKKHPDKKRASSRKSMQKRRAREKALR